MTITVVSFQVVFVLSIYFYKPAYYGDYVYPPNIQGLGWALVLTSMLCVPSYTLYTIFVQKKVRPFVLPLYRIS